MAIYAFGVGASGGLVTIAGSTITDHIKSGSVNYEYAELEITAMGATAESSTPGLRKDSIELELYQDFASSSTDALINAALGVAAGVTVVVQSSGTTVSTTNPKWTLVGIPYTYSPIDAGAGEISMTKVKFSPASGQAIVRATS